jgi:membrane protease YdiL (CAAX protease family)
MRRMYGWETWVVLAIFPLPSTVLALAYLAMHLTVGFEPVDSGFLIFREPVLSFCISIAILLPGFAAAALVFFLLYRNGEGLSSIGLGGNRLRKDLSYLLPVALFVFVIPQFAGSAVVHFTHLPVYAPGAIDLPVAFVVLGLLQSLLAGVVEEVVVLGYLIRRLEQRGWSSALVLVVAVLVRVSYHLYYGPGVLPIVLWAVVSVLAYRKIRRLLPFIICHFVWDASITIAHYSRPAFFAVDATFFALAITFTALWRKVEPNPGAMLLPVLP